MFFFFKQKTSYEMRISDWSSDVCSSDLAAERNAAEDVLFGEPVDDGPRRRRQQQREFVEEAVVQHRHAGNLREFGRRRLGPAMVDRGEPAQPGFAEQGHVDAESQRAKPGIGADIARRLLAADMLFARRERRSEEHTSELQSLMRISYAVFCLKKQTR